MRMLFKLFFIIVIIPSVSFSQKKKLIHDILNQNPALFAAILDHPQKNEVQILYTQINRDKKNKAHFKTYSFNLNNKKYFYPASTIKLPSAVFALEKLNELSIEGLDKSTNLTIDSSFKGETKVTNDLSSKNGKASIENYIKKIFLVSDNNSYNRIFEFTDRKTINYKLKKYGFKNSRIITRLSVQDDDQSNRHTNIFNFYNKDNIIIYQKPSDYDTANYYLKLHDLKRGKGYINNNGVLVNKPFDFSNRNVFQLTDQHEFMKRLFFPSSFPKNKRFNLTPRDYDFLYTYMSRYPNESEYPTYVLPNYYPTYCKFLFYGADTAAKLDPNIRIFNKVGDAYGYAIDNIYLVDYKNKVEFFLTAVVQSNNNEIYNDNIYEYDSFCFPFLKNLGQKIYQFELERHKKHQPNLDYLSKYK